MSLVNSPFFARLSEDRKTVAMRRSSWAHRIPSAELPKWIALYKRLRDRNARAGEKGPYWEFYQPGVTALEREAAKLWDGRA